MVDVLPIVWSRHRIVPDGSRNCINVLGQPKWPVKTVVGDDKWDRLALPRVGLVSEILEPSELIDVYRLANRRKTFMLIYFLVPHSRVRRGNGRRRLNRDLLILGLWVSLSSRFPISRSLSPCIRVCLGIKFLFSHHGFAMA